MNSGHASYLPVLNGLRGWACLAVVLVHTIIMYGGDYKPLMHDPAETLQHILHNTSAYGVRLFFTLSGFLMAYHYLGGENSPRHWGTFLIRRFFRIYPIFLLVLALHGLIYALDLPIFGMAGDTVLRHALLLEGQGIFWTIPVETKFYAYLPLLAMLALRFRSPWHNVMVLSALVLATLVINLPIPRICIDLSAFIGYFLCGAIGGYMQKTMPPENKALWHSIALGCLALTALYCLDVFPVRELHRYSPYYAPWMGLTIFSIMQARGTVQAFFSSRLLAFFGTISYSLYLTHHTVFSLVKTYIPAPLLLQAVLSLLLAVLVGWQLFRAVERPFNRFGRQLSCRVASAQ